MLGKGLNTFLNHIHTMEDDTIFLYIFGGVAVLIAGAILYQMFVHPGGVPAGMAQTPSLVQNEESITWIDWLGRERVITISRKVH